MGHKTVENKNPWSISLHPPLPRWIMENSSAQFYIAIGLHNGFFYGLSAQSAYTLLADKSLVIPTCHKCIGRVPQSIFSETEILL